jgi:hypothetical protein
MTPHTLIYNSRHDEFHIVRPEMKWGIGLPGDRFIREDTYDVLVSWFNGLSQEERRQLAVGDKLTPTDVQQMQLAV